MEVAIFRLKQGITREAFLTTVPATTAYLSSMKGYTSRRLVESETGQWIDLVEWESLADGEAAARIFSAKLRPDVAPFLDALDMSDGSMQHYHIRIADG
jgi:hypothetical protein